MVLHDNDVKNTSVSNHNNYKIRNDDNYVYPNRSRNNSYFRKDNVQVDMDIGIDIIL